MAVIDRFTPRDFSEVLGTLMTSVLDAQAQASRATVDFVNEVGMLPSEAEDAPGQLRTVAINYRKLDENQEEANFSLQVPLLGMVDIPMISVKSATFEFEYEVNTTEETDGESDTGASKRLAARRIKLKGRVKKSSKSQVNSEKQSHLKVKIEIEKAQLPVGLDRLLEIVENATSDKQV